jgi:hypothetical protein
VFEGLVARQAGVVTLAQAAAHGYSPDRVRRRVREGRWRRLHPGVVLIGGHRLTDEARVWAAWLWAGESAVVSGQAAAHWYGMLARAPTAIELTVPTRAGVRSRSGARVRRSDLADEDVGIERGLRVVGRDWRRWVPRSRWRTDRRSSTGRYNAMFRSTTSTAPTAGRWAAPGRPTWADS